MGYYDQAIENKTLAHHGILGMKWGIRRFQNKDGSLTALGKKRMEEGLDVNDRTGKPLEGKELQDAYEKYLREKG